MVVCLGRTFIPIFLPTLLVQCIVVFRFIFLKDYYLKLHKAEKSIKETTVFDRQSNYLFILQIIAGGRRNVSAVQSCLFSSVMF